MADLEGHPEQEFRTLEELTHAVRAVARLFDTDRVYLIGSQAILAYDPDVPREMRHSREFDIYPGNAETWEREHPGQEASEQIAALMGEGSTFHMTHGFLVDGVDKRTATLPEDWESRAVRRGLPVDGRQVEVVAPEPQDLAISKLARLDPKDKQWLQAFHRTPRLGLKRNVIAERLERTPMDQAQKEAALHFVDRTVGLKRSKERTSGRQGRHRGQGM